MNSFRAIRLRIGATQAEVADAVQRSQGNVSLYEAGQAVPPDVARSLIAFARTKGHAVSFDDVYAEPDAPKATKAGA